MFVSLYNILLTLLDLAVTQYLATNVCDDTIKISRWNLNNIFGDENFQEISSFDAQFSFVDRPNAVEHFDGLEDDVVVADAPGDANDSIDDIHH